ncbi:hypothetical protein TGAMA5MH_08108 [Trichoderma gamsii]|uniref:Transmembrane protein n=1 Tax=Trichoderma gamsii TaxID=398673 RepID=A0A2K0T2S6_9HYPO|nr:hypothetical protein TGAMA5MH_08108 [Trichoderma gamsii]
MLASAPILHSVLLLGALFGTVVGALDFGRYDEAHRVTKSVESTQPAAATITTAITTATFTTVTVSARNSDIPTHLGRLRGRVNGDDANQAADTGTSTTSTPETASSAAETDNSGSDSQDSLSSTQLGGIIGGAAAFLALVVAVACVLIRHIDRLADQIAKIPRSSKSTSTRKLRSKPTSVSSSDTDSRDSREGSAIELMQRSSLRRSQARRKPKSTARRNNQRRNGLYIAAAGNPQSERAPERQDRSTNIPLQTLSRPVINRRPVPVPNPARTAIVSPAPVNAISPRLLSSPSPVSAISSELEACSLAQELAGVASAESLAADSLIHYARDVPPSDLPWFAVRPPLKDQWMKSVLLLRQSENASPEHFSLDDGDEEWHGFYGARGYMAGRTGLGITYPRNGHTREGSN